MAMIDRLLKEVCVEKIEKFHVKISRKMFRVQLVNWTSIKICIQQSLLNFRFTSFISIVICLANYVFKTFQFIFFPKIHFWVWFLIERLLL